MKNVSVCLLLLLVATACLVLTVDKVDGANAELSIAAFNIQILGTSKMSKPDVVTVLKKVLVRYDLTLIMEIRDDTNTSIWQLLDGVNQLAGSPNTYGAIVSSRLGRTASKEQYAYMYRKSKLNVLSSYVYNDARDLFEREPFVARFRLAGVSNVGSNSPTDFTLIGIHTKPTDAAAEIGALTTVYQDSVAQLGESDAILLGDFNGDCSYMSGAAWTTNPLRTESNTYTFLIPDTADTTVGVTSCAYDRFVTTGRCTTSYVANSATAFRFDTAYGLTQEDAVRVSDHYPIEMKLSIPLPASAIPVVSISLSRIAAASSLAAASASRLAPAISSSPSGSPRSISFRVNTPTVTSTRRTARRALAQWTTPEELSLYNLSLTAYEFGCKVGTDDYSVSTLPASTLSATCFGPRPAINVTVRVRAVYVTPNNVTRKSSWSRPVVWTF